jgi:hypothetical protein
MQEAEADSRASMMPTDVSKVGMQLIDKGQGVLGSIITMRGMRLGLFDLGMCVRLSAAGFRLWSNSSTHWAVGVRSAV